MNITATPPRTTCPSVQPELPGAHVFAVLGGTLEQPQVSYLDVAVPVTDEIWDMAAPLNPAEMFRISGPCAMSNDCMHFDDERSQCRLAVRTVRMAPVVVSKPPACAIRRTCMWWNQEGVSACLRCPQVVTNDASANAHVVATANPLNIAGAA